MANNTKTVKANPAPSQEADPVTQQDPVAQQAQDPVAQQAPAQEPKKKAGKSDTLTETINCIEHLISLLNSGDARLNSIISIGGSLQETLRQLKMRVEHEKKYREMNNL